MLIMIAAARIKNELRLLQADVIPRLARLIRQPTGIIFPSHSQVIFVLKFHDSDSPEGRRIKKTIIPAVANLRKQFSLSISFVFSSSFIRDFYLSPELDYSDIMESDRFFDSIKYE